MKAWPARDVPWQQCERGRCFVAARHRGRPMTSGPVQSRIQWSVLPPQAVAVCIGRARRDAAPAGESPGASPARWPPGWASGSPFTLVEEWDSEANLRRHLASPPSRPWPACSNRPLEAPRIEFTLETARGDSAGRSDHLLHRGSAGVRQARQTGTALADGLPQGRDWHAGDPCYEPVFTTYGLPPSALEMSAIAFCARTLLPASSSGGETTAMPNLPGDTAMRPPPTPLLAGRPVR